jgi:CRISPR-associated exonuclease Cas4
VTPTENPELPVAYPGERDALPLSLINDILYCPRRAALKIVEGWREGNVHTERGDIAHEHSDLAGYEVARGVLVWRALPVWSERLGLNGKCDLVEVYPQSVGDEVTSLTSDSSPAAPTSRPKHEPPHVGSYKTLVPVEFKLGKRRKWDNDDVQVCAQALCLEEMFGVPIPRGAIFHADSKRRRDVVFTPELRQLTEKTAADLHALLGYQPSNPKFEIAPLPAAVFRPACEECSLYDICLPQLTAKPAAVSGAAKNLFVI